MGDADSTGKSCPETQFEQVVGAVDLGKDQHIVTVGGFSEQNVRDPDATNKEAEDRIGAKDDQCDHDGDTDVEIGE
jgi:hypothetical protein